MLELLLLLTGATLIAFSGRAYAVSRDALHPMVFLGPMLLYQFVVCPWILLTSGTLEAFFPDASRLALPLVVNLLSITALAGGCTWGTAAASANSAAVAQPPLGVSARQQIFRLGCLLGAIAAVSYWVMILEAGGLWQVYGSAKGGVRAASGYLGEAPLLAYPAILLLALSRHRRGLSVGHVALALVFASPHLAQGLLGARRGPTFLICATLALAWYLSRAQRPQLWKVIIGVGALGCLLIFLLSHRSSIYLGAALEVDSETFVETLLPTTATEGSDFVASSGHIIMANELGRHYWGARYLATYLIRPIPKQLWPTKYEDLGVGWMASAAGSGGFSDTEWNEALGWRPTRGSAAGFAADVFLEFSWLGLIVCWVIGRIYGLLWAKSRSTGGLWSILFIQAAALSIYIPTQSVSAVFHRFMFMAIPTYILWRCAVQPWIRNRTEPFRGETGEVKPRAQTLFGTFVGPQESLFRRHH